MAPLEDYAKNVRKYAVTEDTCSDNRIRKATDYWRQHTAVPASAYWLAAGAIITSWFFSMKSSTSFDAPLAALPHFMVP